LFPQASFVGCANIRVEQATDRSDECTADTLFAAIPGTRVDGAGYALEAIGRGAASLLVNCPLASVPVPQCVVINVRKAYAQLCAELAGRPSSRLHLSAVTGTNGKTTITWLLRSILETAGKQVGLLGSIEYSNGIKTEPATLTTPDSQRLSTHLQQMVGCGTTHAAIELSSHALHQDRCAGTRLDAAIVTNVTQDHFDYHHDFDSYLQSKTRIVEHLKPQAIVVLNVDDAGSLSIREHVPADSRVMTFGLESAADVTATIVKETTDGSWFVIDAGGERIEVRSALIGRHNVSNCLAAAAAAIAAGIPLFAIAAGIESLECVPGRMERIDLGQPFEVFVDYAHTDDALRRSIGCLKRITSGRVICVFGAGGDRDRSKRPLLGRAAVDADTAVVTSDNPRSEDPADIIQDILSGFHGTVRRPYVEPDRADAIRWAIHEADPGDSILIAGKGHETEQIIGTERIPFDDRLVVQQLLMQTLQQPLETRNRLRA
jgi:UDP-N-acetylmuramoyl-L-alanyl-D-glutamate--2,6-diaminopimelate ligase